MGDDSLYGANSPTYSLAVQQWIDESHDPANNHFTQATPYGLLPGTAFPDTALTLLSPAEQAAQQNQTPPATPRFDPAVLLNPKSAPKRPASSSEGSERSRAVPNSAGQVSLVERLHNVQERAASPAKRVKTAEEQQRKKKSSNGAHFGGGSALDLNKNGNTPVPPPAQVDLTMSDDDEVEVVQDNMSQMICIGKVEQAYIMMHTVPFPDTKKYIGNHGALGRIKVAFRRAGQRSDIAILVTDAAGKEFGKVDGKTAQAIVPLIDGAKSNGMMWMAWTDPRKRSGGEPTTPGTQHHTLISMTLQLYCPRKNAHGISKYLKNKNAKLTRPQWELDRYDYFNPQTQEAATRVQLQHPTLDAHTNMRAGHASAMSMANYVLRSVDEIRDDVQNVFDSVVGSSEEVPIREPSSHIKTELYPHQKQALHFMWNREQELTGEEGDRSDPLWKPRYLDNGRKKFIHVITGLEQEEKPKPCRGGILADEMGLGKTLSVLSLVADNSSIKDSREFATKKPPRNQDNNASAIQPVINSRATLLVCPLSTMTNWKEQIKDHFPAGSALKWTRYHGSERFDVRPNELADNDIVVTTYHIIAKDMLDRKRALPYINWFRIVLDEAHTIRNPTAQSKATIALPGQRRWAVTGTPVQNRLEDLGALFNFIKLNPFDSTYGFNLYILSPFKAADPEVIPKLQLLVSTVTIRRTKEIIKNEVPGRKDMIVRLKFSKAEQQLHDWFEKDTQRKVNAVTTGDKMGGHSYARILTAILNLRLICAHGRDLLSEEALKTTDGMSSDQPMEIGDEEEELPSLTRQQAYEMLDMLGQTSADLCAYCHKSVFNDVDTDDEDEDGDPPNLIGHMTSCYHVVCPKHTKKLRTDFTNNRSEDGMVRCHFCEDRVKPSLFELNRNDYQDFCDERDKMRKDPKLSKKINSYAGPHTKTQALLNDLAEFHAWSHDHPDERPIKSVVFSSWTTHLDLIEIALKNHSHTYVRLDGRMSRDARDKSMRVFREDPCIRVMLVSIGAGGLGLNLTTANKVFMMEPQFNPAAEAQAVDRVHRLGQDREVTIKRFIMEKSFEEKMLVLQGKKKALADLTMARGKRSKGEDSKRRLEELRSLFR
ncbi:SNF2 family helicase/ATPase-like protein [Macroventuria anomochaeta]|uniref:SNF2 family helicase/ATPase-like protein n=1 Tax=Macroventuria anomochaeta TaxID=301207 RepID=A0ACB6S6X2_9PLEO|nr:SNF2 family helicase/ATPase-like protein [Macroventuria anomochaeta]KAF2629114.1 SNF2 family helicase/ATPase-like protein [Macroventuria anomochaeta]